MRKKSQSRTPCIRSKKKKKEKEKKEKKQFVITIERLIPSFRKQMKALYKKKKKYY